MKLWERYNKFIKLYLQDNKQDEKKLSFDLDLETNNAMKCYNAFLFGLELSIETTNQEQKEKLKQTAINDYIQAPTIESFILELTESETQKAKYKDLIEEKKNNLIRSLEDIQPIRADNNGKWIETYNTLITVYDDLFKFYFYVKSIENTIKNIEQINKNIPTITGYKRTKQFITIHDKAITQLEKNVLPLQTEININIGNQKKKIIEKHFFDSKKLQYHQELKEKNIIQEIPKELLYIDLTSENIRLYNTLISIIEDDTGIIIDDYYLLPLSRIWQVYTGNDKAKLTDNNKRFIYESLEKFRDYIDNIDRSEVIEKWKSPYKTKDTLIKITGSLIEWQKATAKINGKITECIYILNTPILYTNAKYKNQISTTERNVIETSDTNKNKTTINISNYLKNNILQMKGKKTKRTNKILFNTLYTDLEINGKTQRQRARQKIIKSLDQYKKNGFIKSYKIEKDNNQYKAIVISI